MDDECNELEFRGTIIRTSKAAFPYLKDAAERIEAYLASIGEITWNFASLNDCVDRIFEPLLECGPEQVACLMVENISTRCDQLVRLLHLESTLDGDFKEWLAQILNRVSRELAEERNRYMHDKWGVDAVGREIAFVKTDKRPKVGKPQSRQSATLQLNRKTEVSLPELKNLSNRMATVEYALIHARQLLELWRQTGQPLHLDRQWLPACKRKALGHWDSPAPKDGRLQPPPLRYE